MTPREQETTGSGDENRNFKQWRRRRWRKCLFKSEFMLFQNLSVLFHGVQFVKCWQIFLQLNSKGLYLSLKKELEKSLSCVNVLQKTWNWAFWRRGRATTANKCTKSVIDANQSFVLLILTSCFGSVCPSTWQHQKRTCAAWCMT